MICTTIQHHNLEEILGILENGLPAIGMAEIRLDRCPLDENEIETLFSDSDTPLVATCRVAGDGSGTWEEAEVKLLAAIRAGASFADLEIEAPKETGKKIRRACSEYGTTMIRSCHFFEGVPSVEEMMTMVERCSRFGGEIVKIAAMAGNEEDVRRVMSLYDRCEKGHLVAFAMGEAGRESRIDCLAAGAPFTYAALSEEEAAAPGQWSCTKMHDRIFRDRKILSGENPVKINASKSFAQRAIIAAALASGQSRLGGYTPCGDNEAALEVARNLGAEVRVEGSDVLIGGIGRDGEPAYSEKTLFVGESGLLTRLMIPLVAAIGKGIVTIEGRGTLLNRPLKGASDIMSQFGTVLRPLGEDARAGVVKVPLSVQGPLLPGKVDISGKDGSQLISGLLMALPLLPVDSVIHVHDPKSIPYMFITLDVLRKFGIRIGSEMEGGEDFMETQDWALCTGITFKIKGGQKYSAASFDIEGDWSSAANFMVAGALFGKTVLSGMDTASLQADISIMDILMDAGASISQLEDEVADSCPEGGSECSGSKDVPGGQAPRGCQVSHTGLITVQRAPLKAFDTDLNNCPDLFPIVALLAAWCTGTSTIAGFKRLSSKESDRGKAILEMLEKMGVRAGAEDDVMFVEGESLESRILGGRLLKGGEYTSSHDHRMAMALTVASLGADSPVIIDDRDCVAKSFPDFFEKWEQANA
ncbi:MAG: 3-phosphoshikimate 1-carboxyvinyltransferase [Bacteroidales bacterium]|nr:3-phosphoshikimate 1-carboxyvinyltransferase [Bacteroidales bacterium]